ncbi:MAG TPA: hypothetical protein VLK28_04890 [Methylomirabilota bacterium]|nr:hypothetical protein [Methylomirabilota bacterium]
MDRLALRGADLVLVGMHWLWRGLGLSNNTLFVVELDAPVDPERIRRALDRFLDLCPWPAARLARPFPWGALHWAAGDRAGLPAPLVRHRPAASDDERHAALEAELNAAIDPRREPPLRVLILGRLLVLTWFHPLMDPRGGQNLLVHLADLDRHGGRVPEGAARPVFVAAPDPRPLRERGRIARSSLAHMRALAAVPPISLGTGVTARGRIRFRQQRFLEREPAGEDRRATREISWRLALVGRALAELWRRRGLPDVPFLVPISVDLRPKGEPGPIFGNLLAFHFARFRPSETADLPELARTLRGRMAEALRDGQIEANAVAMDFLRYRPLRWMLRELPWTAERETFSFNCADIGEFVPAGTLFGRTVVNAYHAPAILPRPGIGVFFNRCCGQSNLVTTWVEGVVSEDEVTRIVDVIREGLGWDRTC